MKALDKANVLSRFDVLKIIWVPFHLSSSFLYHSSAPAPLGRMGSESTWLFVLVCIV